MAWRPLQLFNFRTVLKFSSRLSLLLRSSDPDSYDFTDKLEGDFKTIKLDTSYIESCIFGLMSLDLTQLIKSKALLAKNFHIQPSEIDLLPMWEYEMFVQFINDAVKTENEEQKREMEQGEYKNLKKMANPSYVQKMANSKMPKMPSMGSFKMPN